MNDASGPANNPRSGPRLSPPLIVFALIFVMAWSAAILIILVNPLRIYPWGLAAKLDDAGYGPTATAYLVDVVAKDPTINTVLIGGSNALEFRPSLLEHILPDTRYAFNISYYAPRPADRAQMVDGILASSHIKRILVTIDPGSVGPSTSIKPGFPSFLYDRSILNDVEMLNATTFRLSLRDLTGRTLFVPDWAIKPVFDIRERAYQRFHTKAQMTQLAKSLDVLRKSFGPMRDRPCSSYTSISDQLLPEARYAAAHGVEFDVIMSPVSLAYWLLHGQALLDTHIAVRRCVTLALDGIPGVRIFSFENDAAVTGDLANFYDPGHGYNPQFYEYMLNAISQDSHRLTRANIDSDTKTLRERILSYHVTDSSLGWTDGNRGH